MRVTKISAKLPVGVKLGGLSGSLEVVDQLFDLADLPKTLRSATYVHETRESNRRLTLILEIPDGCEVATIRALEELIKDLKSV